MPRNRLRLAIYLSAALMAVGGGVGAAVAATSPSATAAGGLTATFSKDSDWGSGYQARYTIKNTSSTTVRTWKVVFALPSSAALGSAWDTQTTKSGSTVTATDRGYNGTLGAGATTTFGFIVNGKGVPTNCTINGAPCLTSGAPPAPRPTATKTTAPAPAPSKTTVTKSPPTTTKPPTTVPKAGSSGAILLAPYVDMGLLSNPGAPTLAQLAAAGGIKAYSMAFVNSAGCKASWFNSFDPRSGQFSDQIAGLRAAGGDVKVSFGGASGIELAQACTDVTALQAEYQAVVTAYQLKFVDFDIEGAAVADTATINRRSTALAALQKANPGLKISLTLPVLPEGLTNDGLNVVKSAKAAGVNVDLVNIMAMDYGRAAQDYGDLAIQAVKSTEAQIKAIYGNTDAQAFKMIGVTPMIGKNDDQGTFAQSDAKDLVTFANANHLGYMSFWEANRDHNACTGALFQCSNITQTANEFTKIFAGFTG